MTAALTFVIPKGFDRRTYLKGFAEGYRYDRADYELPPPGDPTLPVYMFCCGAKLRYWADTFPIEDVFCECGSGVKVASWIEK
jgi:hypothetical protein